MNLLWAFPLSVFLGFMVNYLADLIPMEGAGDVRVCKFCSKPIRIADYLVGRVCSYCSVKVRWRVIFVLFSSFALPLLIEIVMPSNIAHKFWFIISFLFIFHSLGLILVIDIEHKVIYYLTCIVSFLFITPFSIIRNVIFLNRSWYEQPIGLLTGAGICAVIYGLGFIFVSLINTKRKEKFEDVAFGFGDVILGGVLGMWMGFPGIILGMVLSILAGGFVSLIFVIVKKVQKEYQPLTAIPYAPFMIASAVILMFVAYFS